MRPKADENIQYQNVGLFAYERLPVDDPARHSARMERPHRHNDLELAYVESGSLAYIFGGSILTFRPRVLVLFWGGFPHKVHKISPKAHLLGMHMPLSWYLNWKLPDLLTQQLLNGKILQETDPAFSASDLHLLERGVKDLAAGTPEDRKAILLEVEARLWRFASAHTRRPQADPKGPRISPMVLSEVGSRKVEQMALFISENYTRPIRVEDIAASVDLHPNYAMKLFHKSFGATLADYITQHRVSHAQRLLTISDAKILDVALESGFGSLSRFNANFKRSTDMSPKAYRNQVRGRKK